MAFDKLCDSAALDSGLTLIANAIRAKGATAEQLSFPTAMAQAIADISTGAEAALPSVITAIDGGSFVLASETLCGGYSINHALGVTPKGFVIWSDDISVYESSNNYAIKYFCIIAEAYNTGAATNSFANGALVYRAATGKTAVLNNDAASAEASESWANASTVALIRATISYKSNATYKWIAWA